MENIGIVYGHLGYLRPFGIFCSHLLHFRTIWYIFPVLVSCTKKNLATLYGDWRGVVRHRNNHSLCRHSAKISRRLKMCLNWLIK
jgi:hypothetical protein